MVFELTESLIAEIIFAMEDQNAEFVFDSARKVVVHIDDLSESELGDEENVYPLPPWSSTDGFSLREEFASCVRVPSVQGELREVLANGRGVFKNYKTVLKQYPHIEKRFLAFKKQKMRSVVYEWYNALRDSWGLETLSQDFEDYDDLVQEDFEFQPYNHEKDSDCILHEAENIASEIKSNFPGETGEAIAHVWRRKFDFEASAQVGGIISRTLSDDVAGVLLYARFPSFSQKTAAFIACFVNQNYRGLGICRELFAQSISTLKNLGIHDFIIADAVIPDYIEPLLTRCGFEKKGSVYTAVLA